MFRNIVGKFFPDGNEAPSSSTPQSMCERPSKRESKRKDAGKHEGIRDTGETRKEENDSSDQPAAKLTEPNASLNHVVSSPQDAVELFPNSKSEPESDSKHATYDAHVPDTIRSDEVTRGGTRQTLYYPVAPSSRISHHDVNDPQKLRQAITLYKKARDDKAQELLNANEVLRLKDEECENLRHQIGALKQSIAGLCHGADSVSDDAVASDMKRLANDIQNWTVKTFRTAVLIDHPCLSSKAKHRLSTALPNVEETIQYTFPVCQAIVVGLIMHIFRTSYILDGSGRCIEIAESHLKATASTAFAKIPEWRCLTSTIMYSVSDEDFEKLTNAKRQEYAVDIIKTTKEIFQVDFNETQYRALLKILLKAMQLWKTTRMQRAHYEFILPEDNQFDSDSMVNQYGQDEPELQGCRIAIPMFPMLMKYGDEHGENMEVKNVISKARVLCFGG